MIKKYTAIILLTSFAILNFYLIRNINKSIVLIESDMSYIQLRLTSDIDEIRQKNYSIEDKLSETSFESRCNGQHLETLDSYVDYTNQRIDILESIELGRRDIYFNLCDGFNKFSTLETDTGKFLVCIQDIKPTFYGYKIIFNVGNISSATYENIDISVSCNRSLDAYFNDAKHQNNVNIDGQNKKSKKNYTSTNSTRPLWLDEFKDKSFKFYNKLSPGYWTVFEIEINAASKNEIEVIKFSMHPNSVRLNTL